MKTVLFLVCIAGSLVHYWRWMANEGFGAGRLNAPLFMPPILVNEGIYLLVFALGFTLKWGSVALLAWRFGWPLAVTALLVGFGASRVLVPLLCRRYIEEATEFNRELAERKVSRRMP